MRSSKVRNPHSVRKRVQAKARRSVTGRKLQDPFCPSEDWHEPTGKPGYRVIVKPAGWGYRHVVNSEQIRARLEDLPRKFLHQLEVVQLGCMTNKKNRFPCYGMQWGCAIYLYPFDETMEEVFGCPPPRPLVIEAKMYGARIVHTTPGIWRLVWTDSSARDFQLNNVLIHELGHLLDSRNTSYIDMERYAEWFAIQHGYLATGGSSKPGRQSNRRVRRRHHGK